MIIVWIRPSSHWLTEVNRHNRLLKGHILYFALTPGFTAAWNSLYRHKYDFRKTVWSKNFQELKQIYLLYTKQLQTHSNESHIGKSYGRQKPRTFHSELSLKNGKGFHPSDYLWNLQFNVHNLSWHWELHLRLMKYTLHAYGTWSILPTGQHGITRKNKGYTLMPWVTPISTALYRSEGIIYCLISLNNPRHESLLEQKVNIHSWRIFQHFPDSHSQLQTNVVNEK